MKHELVKEVEGFANSVMLHAYRQDILLALKGSCINLESALAKLNYQLNKPGLRCLLSDDETIEVWERIQKLQRIIDDVKYLAKPL